MIFNFIINILISLSSACLSLAPPLEMEHVETIKVEADIFMTDALGNIYWVDHNGLTRYEPGVSRSLNYSNPRLGSISFIDVSDPLNILVFYSQAGVIEFLDRNLVPRETPQSTWNWMESGPPSLVAVSAQQGFWSFFPATMSLRRFDMRMNTQARNDNIQQQIPGFADPVFMVESQNKLFINSAQKIYVFDTFANYLFSISNLDTEEFQVTANNLIYFTSQEMRIFNFVNSTETVYLLPEDNVKRGFVRGRHLIFRTNEAIHRYYLQHSIF